MMTPELITAAVRTLEVLLLLPVEHPTLGMIEDHAILELERAIATRKQT